MEIVVDTNILFSFFRKDSITRKIIIKGSKYFFFHSPETCLIELRKYKELICQKAKISFEDFEEDTLFLSIFIKIVPISEIKNFIPKAREISPDIEDIPIFALALKLNCPIWSNDKELKKQNVVKVYSTKELIEEFGLEI